MVPRAARHRVPAIAAVLACLAFLAGCSSDPPVADPSAGPSRTVDPSPTSPPTPELRTIEDKCGMAVPGRLREWDPDAETSLVGSVLGEATDVAIFLHQTDQEGFCLWAPTPAGWPTRAALAPYSSTSAGGANRSAATG